MRLRIAAAVIALATAAFALFAYSTYTRIHSMEPCDWGDPQNPSARCAERVFGP